MKDTEPRTISVPEAGRIYLGIGRDASYEAAKRGEIPVIQVGRLKRVPIIAMERILEQVVAVVIVVAIVVAPFLANLLT